jgi:FixJ family two-component response regulator/putative methionine-R-sulfoxide reductase with GAF domain
VANQRASVLVVNDERFLREAVRDALSENGFNCTSCERGETAMTLAAAQSFAVAIVDLRLPEMSGVELLKALHFAQPDMQVIVLSSAQDQELVLDALRSGAVEYLGKPLHDEELILAVQRAVAVNGLSLGERRLGARLDDLAARIEGYARVVTGASAEERHHVICDEAALLVAHALGAQKASLLLLDRDGGNLEVVALVGSELEPEQIDPIKIGRGIAGRAFEDAIPMVVSDVRNESHFAADLAPDRYATNSFVIAPVALPTRQFGLLCATDRSDGGEFDLEDLAVLRALAIQVAERLDREADVRVEFAPVLDPSTHDSTALFADHSLLDLAVDEPDALLLGGGTSERDSEIARAICDVMSNEIDPANLIPKVLHAIELALDADPVSLYLINAQTGELVLEGTGTRGLRVDRDVIPVGRGLMEGVLVRGQLVAVSDPEQDPRYDASVDAPVDEKPGALLAVPLKLRGKSVGLCRLYLAQGSVISAGTGEMLAAVLSAAVRNVLLYRSLLESIEEVAQVRREAKNETQNVRP